jgi:monovalent cation:proton antiporter-2 (CPA2) family protein
MDMSFLFVVAIILICTKTFALFTKKLHMPQVVGALLAGVVLGPAVLGLIRPTELLGYLAEIGVVLLMFNAGLEMDFRQLKESIKSSFFIAVLGVLLPLAGGFLLAYAFGGGTFESIFIGVILTATSVSITVETLQEMGKLKTKAGTAILGAAIIDDILGIILLAVIMQIGDGGAAFSQITLILVKILLFFIIAFLAGFAVFKLFEYFDSRFGNKRRVSILALSFCFFLSYFAELFGIADIIGAFIAGIILCNTKSVQYIQPKINSLSYMLFSPVFFVSIGLTTSFTGFNNQILLFTGLLLFIAIATKLLGCGLAAKFCRFTSKESIQIGLGMVSRGEVALIVAVKGASMNLMKLNLLPSIIMVVPITTLITPVLLKLAVNTSPNTR